MFSMVISVISVGISVILVDFGDFGQSCYPDYVQVDGRLRLEVQMQEQKKLKGDKV